MTATETLWTDPSFVFTGTWGTNSNAGHAGGSANLSSTIGDQVTITWTGRTLLLLTTVGVSNADIQITTDGATRAQTLSGFSLQGSAFRVPVIVERNLADGVHTTVLKSVNVGAGTQMFINGVLAITGPRVTKGTGRVLLALGDSWTFGTGVAAAVDAHAGLLRRKISQALNLDYTLSNRGVSGAGFANKNAQNSANMVEQLALGQADGAERINMLAGVNDLATANGTLSGTTGLVENPALFASLVRTTLQFLEDLYDVTTKNAVKVVVGTPGYITPFYRWSSSESQGVTSTAFGDEFDAYELGVVACRRVLREFPWVTVADVYRAMDRRNTLLYPNNNADEGLHPGGAGHELISECEFDAHCPSVP